MTTDEFAPQPIADLMERTMKDHGLKGFVIGKRRVVSRNKVPSAKVKVAKRNRGNNEDELA